MFLAATPLCLSECVPRCMSRPAESGFKYWRQPRRRLCPHGLRDEDNAEITKKGAGETEGPNEERAGNNKYMSDSKHIHLIGICGTAMASLAGMLKQRGFRVTGSDAAAYPPMSDFLGELGIPVAQPFDPRNVDPQNADQSGAARPDLVVVGNAVSRGNVELEQVLDQGIPLCSLPQLLHDEFLRGKEVLVVAGTHGKTTTTSMLAWIFHTAGLQPSFLIGGIAENFASSFQLGQGKHFIIEGDEYDSAFFDKGPKFLHYFSAAGILTSVEFDHADIYKDLDAVETAFKRLVNLVPRRGRIIAFDSGDASSESLNRCVQKAFCPVERYGTFDRTRNRARWKIANLKLDAERTSWSVVRDGEPWADFEFPLGGEFNVWNATAAAALAANYEISKDVMAKALKTFRSVKRRLEVKAQVNGITIIDDFAHHPTAIEQTILALRARYPKSRLWVVLEPRSNTMRRNVLQDALSRSLALADQVVIAAIFKSEAIPEAERLDLQRVIDEIQKRGKQARIFADADAIVNAIAPELRERDVVSILSNGGFGGIYEKLPQRLRGLAVQPLGVQEPA